MRGRADYLELGTWNALCDRCQRKYKANELRKEWTGWMVCESCWDPQHEQEFLKGHVDNPQVPWTRPDSNGDTSVTTVDGESLTSDNYRDLVTEDKTLIIGTHNGVQECATTFTADITLTLDTTGAQSQDRWIVSRTAGGDFDLIIGSVKTTRLQSTTVVEYRNGAFALESFSPHGL